MWKSIYDSLLQALTSPFATFIHSYGDCGRKVRDKFYTDIYPTIGLELFLITILILLIYYYYFNFRFGKYYSKVTYFTVLLINSLLVGVITYITAHSYLNKMICPVSSHLIWISIINFIYAAILYFLLSISIFKWLSPMGKRTPF